MIIAEETKKMKRMKMETQMDQRLEMRLENRAEMLMETQMGM